MKGQFYNQKIDIYSAGTVLYEMLYGVMPYKGRDKETLLQSIDQGKPEVTEASVSNKTQNLLK